MFMRKYSGMGKFMIEENPQVAYWRKLYEGLKKDVEAYKELANERVNRYESLLRRKTDDYEFAKNYNKRIVDKLNKKSEEMEKFNELPWWKKMFFRFDV